ncbi:hypothetical protein ACFL3E_02125 [Patescibacteria group bacterium]
MKRAFLIITSLIVAVLAISMLNPDNYFLSEPWQSVFNFIVAPPMFINMTYIWPYILAQNICDGLGCIYNIRYYILIMGFFGMLEYVYVYFILKKIVSFIFSSSNNQPTSGT